MLKKIILLFFHLLVIQFLVFSQGKNKSSRKVEGVFKTDIPEHLFDIILGRPTDQSVTVSILANQDMKAQIEYGENTNKLSKKSNQFKLTKGITSFINIEKLEANKRYFYRLNYTPDSSGKTENSEINFFITQRKSNADFSFVVQADSHLDENTSTEMYLKTLDNMAADSADFLVDLGDTWMTDKYRKDYKESFKQYIAQRYYFGKLCKSTSLFLTLGNHDGESGQQLKKQSEDNMTTWATATRKSYYPNPFPNQFYTGNNTNENKSGLPENYYSWQWGNALFIVLDPFRNTINNKEPWQRTLGNEQYQWLKNTLEKSKAKFKFIFIHNLVGGADNNGIARGGAEAATHFEWGGLDTNNINNFSKYRSQFEKPIHDLLVANKVNIVFHGHDHFFAKQDSDELVYQLIPQPGSMRYGNTNSAIDYGYKNGTILNAPGYVRINIQNNKATIDYIQTSIDAKHKNKEVLYSYTID